MEPINQNPDGISPSVSDNKKIFSLVFLAFVIPFSIFLFVVIKYRNTPPTSNDTISIKPIQPTEVFVTPTPQITPLPILTSAGDIIQSAEIGKDCNLQIKTTNKTFSISTELKYGGTENCAIRPYGKISPSQKYLVYADSSGGVDSAFLVFDLAHGKKFTLGVWGTSSIMDYIFLPDDQVAVINGYPDIFEEQWLGLIDLPKIFTDYQTNFDPKYLYLRVSNPTYHSNINLPNTNTTHSKLAYVNGKIQTLSKEGKLLVQYSPQDLVLNSSNFSITPKTALTLTFYYDERNVNPDENPSVTRKFNAANSTNEYWAVDIINTKTDKTLRQYQVNSKTGLISIKE